MIYITGDTHGDFGRIMYFSKIMETSLRDVMIILGDAGVNYHLNSRDEKKKQKLSSLSLTIFCVHGNHEQRPQEIDTYIEKIWRGGIVYVELAYPNILFAKDGEVYDFEGAQGIVLGGAYSVDKDYRLKRHMAWFENEQMSEEDKYRIEDILHHLGWKIDIVLSHTAPLKYEPQEVFLPMIHQDTVDKSMEIWLDYIEDRLVYKQWYCGHYHTKKSVDKLQIMYDDYTELDKQLIPAL